MDGLQIHILHANYAQVHKQAPIKMAAGAVSMVFHLRAWFWKCLFCGSLCFEVNYYLVT